MGRPCAPCALLGLVQDRDLVRVDPVEAAVVGFVGLAEGPAALERSKRLCRRSGTLRPGLPRYPPRKAATSSLSKNASCSGVQVRYSDEICVNFISSAAGTSANES